MEVMAPPQRVQCCGVPPRMPSHLHRCDLIHLRSHQLDAVEDLFLVASQCHAHSQDVPEERGNPDIIFSPAYSRRPRLSSNRCWRGGVRTGTHSMVIWDTISKLVKPSLVKFSLYWPILMASSHSSTVLKEEKSGVLRSRRGK